MAQEQISALNQLQKIIFYYSCKPFSKSQSQIAKLAKCSRTTVYRIQDQLCDIINPDTGKTYFTRDANGTLIKDAEQIQLKYGSLTETSFAENSIIQEFIASMKRSKKDPQRYLSRLYVICETLQVEPDALVGPIFETQKLVDMFEELFKQGKAKYIGNNQFTKGAKEDSSVNHYIKTVKMLRDRLGKETTTGYLEVKEQSFDIYKRIKLTDKERLQGIEFFKQFGEDWVKIFVLHNEFGVRSNTLFALRPIFEKRTTGVDGNNCEYYVCYPYEIKQKHEYQKIIITKEAREIVSKLENGKPLLETNNEQKARRTYNKYLRMFYASIGKIELDQDGKAKQYPMGTMEYYYAEDPSHAIRHSTVHWLMRITGFRSDVVKSFFWDVPDTLSVYQQSTVEELMSQGICYYCSPPPQIDENFAVFCTLRHATAYHNGFRK